MNGVTSLARRVAGALPAGTGPVGAGLAVLGIAAYGFLAIAGHVLDPRGYSDLAVLWMIVFSVGPGLFFPFEQELARLVAARRAQGTGAGPVTARIAVVGAVVLAGLLVLTLVAREPLADSLFDGDVRLVDVLAANLVALTAAHLSRGLLAGHGQFSRYGTQLALDGLLRVAMAAALAIYEVREPASYGLVLAAAPLLAVVLTASRRAMRLEPGPTIPYSELTAGLGLLIASSTFWLAVVNAGVVSARLLATTPAQVVLAGALLSGLVLARIPLFVFSSVQASLLPALSGAATAEDQEGFRRLLARTVAAVAGLGAAGSVVCVAAGPWLVGVLFDAEPVLGRADFVWLTTATTVYMIATVLGQAVLALAGHRDQTLGWAAGFMALVGVTLLPGEILVRVEMAYLAGSAVAAAALTAALYYRLRRWTGHLNPAVARSGSPDPAENRRR